MVALTTVLELLNLLQLSLNAGVRGASIVSESMEIFKTAFTVEQRDLTPEELMKIRLNNQKIREEFLSLGSDSPEE